MVPVPPLAVVDSSSMLSAGGKHVIGDVDPHLIVAAASILDHRVVGVDEVDVVAAEADQGVEAAAAGEDVVAEVADDRLAQLVAGQVDVPVPPLPVVDSSSTLTPAVST